MRSSFITTAFFALTLHGVVTQAADEKTKPKLPCTAHSSAGSFYDLTDITLKPPEDGKKASKKDRTESWHARGWDYGSNFTLNICAPVIEELKDVVGIDSDLWKNVSAYYESGGKTYSIGQQASDPLVRGRKLVLQYENGSPCSSDTKRDIQDRAVSGLESRDSDGSSRRKSTTISFQCERDPLAAQAAVSFVASSPDNCSYFFEVRSAAACAALEPAEQGVGPGGVFGIILLIAVIVYFIGGVIYQRNVRNARGWRQLPNYSLWAGIGSFIQDTFIIATASCARFLPSRRGYRSLSVSANGNGSSRGRSTPDDENRLIDQLDEEWDD